MTNVPCGASGLGHQGGFRAWRPLCCKLGSLAVMIIGADAGVRIRDSVILVSGLGQALGARKRVV